MEPYTALGRTDLLVSRLGFGAARIGEGTPLDQVEILLNTLLDAVCPKGRFKSKSWIFGLIGVLGTACSSGIRKEEGQDFEIVRGCGDAALCQ